MRRAGRTPDPPRTDVDADQKVPIGYAFDGPLPLAHEVALPERGGMAFPEIVPGVRGGVRIVALPRLPLNVAHRQSPSVVYQSLQRLPDFGVSPPRLGAMPVPFVLALFPNRCLVRFR